MEGDPQDGGERSEAFVAVLFPFVAVVFGCLARQLLLVHNAFPYTAVLLILGGIFGTIDYHGNLGILGDSMEWWINIPGELILYVFLPALIFADTMTINVHLFKKSFVQAVLLAGPGLALGAFLTALVGKYVFPYDWSWAVSMTLGSILAATDPVAVVSMLKELGASPTLSMLVSAESLLNDGSAVVLYALFVNIAEGQSYGAWGVIKFLLQNAVAGPCIGIAFGIGLVAWLSVTTDLLVEISLTVATAYLSYFVADDPCGSSGVLATVFTGITMSFVGRANITGKGTRALGHVWETLEFIGNTIIFFLSGMIIAARVLDLGERGFVGGREWGLLFALYAFVILIRFAMLILFYPLLYFSGYGMDWRKMFVVGWGGLRGAVGLALALAVEDSPLFENEETRSLVLFYVSGIVILTLVLNGPSTGFVLRLLGLSGSRTFGRELLLHDVENYLGSKDAKHFREAVEALAVGTAHQEIVAQFLPHMKGFLELSEAQLERRRNRGHAQFSTHDMHHLQYKLVHVTTEVGMEHRLDQHEREEFLRGLHLSYLNWMRLEYAHMLESGSLSRDAFIILDYALEVSMDYVGDVEKASQVEWEVVEEFLGWTATRPGLLGLSHAKALVGEVVGLRWTSDVETGLHVCLAYLQAHRHSREQVDKRRASYEQRRRHSSNANGDSPGFWEDSELFSAVNRHASGLLWTFLSEVVTSSQAYEDRATAQVLRMQRLDATAVEAAATTWVILHLLHMEDGLVGQLHAGGFLTSQEADSLWDRNEHARMAAGRYHAVYRAVRHGPDALGDAAQHNLHVGWVLCRGLCG